MAFDQIAVRRHQLRGHKAAAVARACRLRADGHLDADAWTNSAEEAKYGAALNVLPARDAAIKVQLAHAKPAMMPCEDADGLATEHR